MYVKKFLHVNKKILQLRALSKFYIHFLCVGFTLTLASCGIVKKKHVPEKIDTVHQDSAITIDEARLIDVPIPFDVRWCFAYDYDKFGGYFATYQLQKDMSCQSDMDFLVTYYQQEMESAGWDNGIQMHYPYQEYQVERLPAILSFEKPHKLCLITISDDKSGILRVSLLIIPKRSSLDYS